MAELEEENEVFGGCTPYSNTGYLDTEVNSLRALVDWVSVTFSSFQNLEQALEILQLPIDKFEIKETGFFGYKKSAKYGNMLIGWEPVSASQNGLGVHVAMSGQACREYERHFKLNMDWSEFFSRVMLQKHKFTRLDIAIDDFKGVMDVAVMYKTAKAGCMTAQRVKFADNWDHFRIKDGATEGQTLYVGRNNWMFRFYDKKNERLQKGLELPENITVWNRYEIQLRGDIANQAAHALAYEAYTFGEFARGFFSAKIDFKIKNKSDSNKSRWKSKKWWVEFLDGCEKIQLSQIAPDPTIPRIKNWIDYQVDTSFATLVKAFGNQSFVYDYFYYKGREKMGRKHENILEEFEQYPELRQQMLDEMIEYIQEMRESDYQGHLENLTAKILDEKKELAQNGQVLAF